MVPERSKTMLKPVIILGAGGHAKVIADIVVKSGGQLAGFLDDTIAIENPVLGYPVLGKIHELPRFGDEFSFVIGIGSHLVRKAIDQRYPVNWYTAIHPTASIALGTVIGEGTVIMANAVVNACAHIGRHCIINTGAIVEHDDAIFNYTHLSPNSALGGNVTIDSNVHIGIGATVRNGIHIADDCVVGAGAVVVKDITESGTYVGIPAKRMRA
jgi:sugar O-acyltransferase (sialic acid O-acetyltransferase NeuD family)